MEVFENDENVVEGTMTSNFDSDGDTPNISNPKPTYSNFEYIVDLSVR